MKEQTLNQVDNIIWASNYINLHLVLPQCFKSDMLQASESIWMCERVNESYELYFLFFLSFLFRAFCAWEENLPVDADAELAEQCLQHEYKTKLKIADQIIPDPFSLKSGWNGEKNGLASWPSIYITDISHFLHKMTTNEIVHRLLNEYKEGKAFRYFENGWVKEVHIHGICENSNVCVLKSKVTPSQALNKKAYDTWVAVKKDRPEGIGGEVLASYCSCTAGMLGCCNHVAGVLFRIEDAVKRGNTKSKTSVLSTWNVPKSKPIMKPIKAADVTWTKSSYGKERSSDEVKHKHRQNFTPLNSEHRKIVNNEDYIRKTLFNLCKEDLSDSCFGQLQEKKRHINKQLELPLSIIDITFNEMEKPGFSLQSVLNALPVTNQDLSNINSATLEQASSDIWHNQRHGRITASIFHRVASRARTLEKDENTDLTSIMDTILGNKATIMTVAMKHGLSLEPVAKKSYTKSMKKVHRKFISSESGLRIHATHPYLGASPDLLVKCDCCGEGLCEIKCPETLKETEPTADNVKCIVEVKGKAVLDQKHPYYTQIQGQMGILGRKYCDLYIFSLHGSLTVRVDFSSEFWTTLETNLSSFWKKQVFTAICERKTCSSVSEQHNQIENHSPLQDITPNINQNNNKITASAKQTVATTSTSSVRRALIPICSQPSKRKKTNNTVYKALVFLCGVCGLDCLDNPQSDDEQSVQCEKCSIWTHYICAGMTDSSLSAIDKWFCKICQ